MLTITVNSYFSGILFRGLSLGTFPHINHNIFFIANNYSKLLLFEPVLICKAKDKVLYEWLPFTAVKEWQNVNQF